MQRSITVQVHTARERPRDIISNALKEIEKDRNSGQPDVPGLNVRQDDFGTLVPGCGAGLCPEFQFTADYLSLQSKQQALDFMVPDGSNYKTPVRGADITDVWFDDLPADEGIHYDKVDGSTITPKQPLSAGTQVKVRFLKY